MSLPLPTNATVNIERKGGTISTGVAALVLPARPEIAITREVPATKAFKIFFSEIVDVAIQDFVVDGAKRYLVKGAEDFDTPPASHTEVVAEIIWERVMLVYDARLLDDTLQKLIAAYDQAPEITARHTMRAINQSLVSYQGTARQLAPIRDGMLRGSIQIEPARHEGNRISGAVATNVPYAIHQEQGTGIYGPTGTPIRPKRAPVLAWQSGGKWHFAKSVKGSRPRWYMRGSLEQNQQRVNGYFATAAREVAKELAGGVA